MESARESDARTIRTRDSGDEAMSKQVSKVINERTGQIVASNAVEADNMWKAFKGLMFRSGLGSGEAMVFRPARGIHTHFMRFPIDLIFLDKQNRVKKVRPAMVPWRFD